MLENLAASTSSKTQHCVTLSTRLMAMTHGAKATSAITRSVKPYFIGTVMALDSDIGRAKRLVVVLIFSPWLQ